MFKDAKSGAETVRLCCLVEIDEGESGCKKEPIFESVGLNEE